MDPISLKNIPQLWGQIHESVNPIIFSLSLILFIFLLSLKLKHKTTINSPPSPPQLPIIGNLHQLGSLPHRSLALLSQKHGPLMLLKLGQTPTLIISSPNLAKQAMKSHDITFSNRAQNRAAKALLYNCKDVAFASYGEQWRQARKICILELLSPKRVDSFKEIREQEIGVLVKRVREAEYCVNLSHLLMSTSNNIVSRCVLGEKYEGENGFGELTRKAMGLLSAFCVGDAFPWLWWVDVLRGFCGELNTTFQKLDGLLDRVIQAHREKKRSCDNGEKDFVDILLRLQQDHTLNYGFTKDGFKPILLDMFIGGTDTTATSLEWTMTELIRNPTTMKKLQEEIRTIIGKKQKIETTDIEKMEYMKCVIKESLRLHPPVPLLLPRQTSSNVNFEGYQIPPKTSVWINVWAIQRDPTIWERPNEFIPERFMDKNSVDFKGQDFEFFPFGSGRRMCIGMSFGLAAFECTLANLLYWFDWEMSGELDMNEEHGLSVFKKVPLNLIPIPRCV